MMMMMRMGSSDQSVNEYPAIPDDPIITESLNSDGIQCIKLLEGNSDIPEYNVLNY